MIGSGVAAAIIATGYTVAVLTANQAGLQVSSRSGGIAVCAVLGFTLLSAVGWLVQAANRNSARRDLPPVLATAIEQSSRAIAEAVAELLVERIEQGMAEIAEKTHARTVTAMREVVTSELIAEELDAVVKRVHRYGMITEAAGRANVAAFVRRE